MGQRFVVVKSAVAESLRNVDSSRSDDFEDKLIQFYEGFSPKAAIKEAEGKRLWKVRQTAAGLRGIGVWWGEFDEDDDFDSPVTDIYICFLLYEKDDNEEFKDKVPVFVAEGEEELADVNEFGPESYLSYHRERTRSRVLPPHEGYIGRES